MPKTSKPLDPKQIKFLAGYTNPNSKTFGNGLQSALKAGYKQEYAESLTSKMPDWLSENVGSMRLLHKAEKALEETLDLICIDDKGNRDNQALKIKQDTAKFTAETIGKKKYSKRQEVTGADGQDIKHSLEVSFVNSPTKDD
jgi:hypothetical protein